MDFIWDARFVEVRVQLSDCMGVLVNFQDEKSFVGSYGKYIFFICSLEVVHMSLFFEIFMSFQYKSWTVDLHVFDLNNVNMSFFLTN